MFFVLIDDVDISLDNIINTVEKQLKYEMDMSGDYEFSNRDLYYLITKEKSVVAECMKRLS